MPAPLLNMPTNNQDPHQDDDYQKLDTKRFFQVSLWVTKFVYKLSPTYTVTYAVTQILDNLSDIGSSLIMARLTDVLISATQNPTYDVNQIYRTLAIIFGFSLLLRINNILGSWARSGLNIMQPPVIKREFAAKLNSIGIQTLEQPTINNKIFRAESHLNEMLNFLRTFIDITARFIKLVTVTLIVLNFAPVFVPIILVSMVPVFLYDSKFRLIIYKFFRVNTEKRRKAAASLNDILGTKTIPEISLVQGFNFFDNKYWNFQKWYSETWRNLQLKLQSITGVAMTFADLVIIVAVSRVIGDALQGLISVGDTIFRYRTLNQFQTAIRSAFVNINDLTEQAIHMADVYDVFTMEPDFKDGHIKIQKLPKGPQIVFKNVSFKYPNSEKDVLKDLNLEIKSGEKIAIVGANGAGKTTLIKIICKIYQHQKGNILINEHNLNDLKSKDWYKNIGILFQDYNIYPQLTVRENIYIGNTDEPVDETAVHLAAQQADATEFINNFPLKWDQTLNEKFKGGIRPSTGQWQKLAIARFFYRNAPLVIFDEPTASIDAVSEYNIFNRIYEFFKNKTVIIISHRFSTVRNADRIIVLDHGTIIEQGTHEQLMANKGKYSEAFILQAQGYTEKLY